MKIQDFKKMKLENQKISMVTCYDYWSAQIIEQTDIDTVLVGDSLAMVMHGHESTIPAHTDLMCLHIQAVSKGLKTKFLVGDMPFLSYRKSLDENMKNVEAIMRAGAHSIKLEGVEGNLQLIGHIVESGIPVMGHIGLTPQFIHKFGGFKVQGREKEGKEYLMSQARKLEDAGCFSLVLEAIPSRIATSLSKKLLIPTIGIGAGPDTDGQVLVLQDLLGMNNIFKPQFLRTYLNGFELIQNALNEFNHTTKEGTFPNESESYQ